MEQYDCIIIGSVPAGLGAVFSLIENAPLEVIDALKPDIMGKNNISVYQKRAKELGVELLDIRQTHLGTDGGIKPVKKLMEKLAEKGIDIALEENVVSIDHKEKKGILDQGDLS